MISCPDGLILRCVEGHSCNTITDSTSGLTSGKCLALRDMLVSKSKGKEGDDGHASGVPTRAAGR